MAMLKKELLFFLLIFSAGFLFNPAFCPNVDHWETVSGRSTCRRCKKAFMGDATRCFNCQALCIFGNLTCPNPKVSGMPYCAQHPNGVASSKTFSVSPVDSTAPRTEICSICLEEKNIKELRPICGNVSSKGIMCGCKCCGACTTAYLKVNTKDSLINLLWPKIGDWKFQGARRVECSLRQQIKNSYFNQWIKFRNYSPILIKDKLIISAPKIITAAGLWLALLGVGACGVGVNLFKAINGEFYIMKKVRNRTRKVLVKDAKEVRRLRLKALVTGVAFLSMIFLAKPACLKLLDLWAEDLST